MYKIECTCQLCGNTYCLYPSLAKRNKYCSKLCHNRANAKANSIKYRGETHWNTGKGKRLSDWATIKCKFCLITFECEPNQYKSGRKFCSKSCFDSFQTNRGDNAKRIWIRESIKLFGHNCEKCGQSNGKIDTHHIDRNRKNNPPDGSNWMRLCDFCHKSIHKAMNKRAPVICRSEFLCSNFVE